MIGMKFLVLLLLSTLVLGQDDRETDLAELRKELDDESQLEEDIQQEELEESSEDMSLDAEREEDRHVVRLNSTQRRIIQTAITNTTQEIERLEGEASAKGCSRDKIIQEVEDETPADVLSNLDIKPCAALFADLLELKLMKNVFTGVKLVDDEVRDKELLYLPKDTRKKRSLERTAQLATLTEELENGAKLLGKDTTGADVREKRDTAATLANLAKTTCSYTKSFLYKHFERARGLGGTIQVSVGGDVGIVLTKTADIALTYGHLGEFGCAASVCTGWRSNIGFSWGGISLGYYYNFDDVRGKSKATIYTGDLGLFSASYGTVETPEGRKIGIITGVSFGKSLLPFDVAVLNCDTIMTTPGCTKTKVSFTEKYYNKCGWQGWSRCPAYKTSYRYRYYC